MFVIIIEYCCTGHVRCNSGTLVDVLMEQLLTAQRHEY